MLHRLEGHDRLSPVDVPDFADRFNAYFHRT